MLTVCHEWHVICTNFRTNKSTCQRKETWKGCCPAAQLKCNRCWWNSVGWRITAVRKKRLHQMWRLAWLLFSNLFSVSHSRLPFLSRSLSLSLFCSLFCTHFLSVITNPKYVRWTFKRREKKKLAWEILSLRCAVGRFFLFVLSHNKTHTFSLSLSKKNEQI